jgi:ribosomal protein S15P/S13E
MMQQKKNWVLTPHNFRLLLNWLDEAGDSQGQKYLEIRQRLVSYFDRKNCIAPDELADETLDRVARRLNEEGWIESDPPAKYCYIVARFVFQEHLRGTQKDHELQNELIHADCRVNALRRTKPQSKNNYSPALTDVPES